MAQTTNDFINKSPDQITEKLREGFVWGTQHLAIFAGIVAIFVVGAIVSFVSEKSSSTKLQSASQDLSVVIAKIEAEQKSFYESQKGQKNPVATFKPSEALIAEVVQVATKHADTAVGQGAMIEASRYLSQAGQYEKAIQNLEPLVPKAKSSLLKGLLVDDLAYNFSAAKQCDKLSGLIKTGTEGSTAYLKNTLLYRSALCLVEQEKLEEALLALVSIKFDDSEGPTSTLEKTLSKLQNPGAETLRVRDPLKEPVESLIKQIKLSKLANTAGN